MATVTILENEFVSMWYYPDKRILHHQFHKHIWGDMFRETLDKGLEVFARDGGNKWLSDDRENCALSAADTEWAINNWFQRVLKAGWKFWAIVLPKHVIGQMNMKRFIDTYSASGVVVVVFDSPRIAMDWLDNPSNGQ